MFTLVRQCVAESLFGSVGKGKKNRKTDVFLLFLAPPVGLEPTTLRLTVVVTRISNSIIRFHAV